MYTGSLAEDIVKDVQEAGGIITLDDLANYKVVRRKPIMDEIGDLTLYTMSAPTAGPIVVHILNILKGESIQLFRAPDLGGGADTVSRVKIKAYPESRRIFLPYPVSLTMLFALFVLHISRAICISPRKNTSKMP